jgi:hypothetical protein
MRPDYDDTEWRKAKHEPFGLDEAPIPWWMALIGGGLVMLALGLMIALCITGG